MELCERIFMSVNLCDLVGYHGDGVKLKSVKFMMNDFE